MLFGFGGPYDFDDGKIELGGELEVPLVVRRNGHDGAGAVAGENVVGDPDRDLLTGGRIEGTSAGEDAGFFLGQFRPFEVGFPGDFGLVTFDGRPSLRPCP